MICLEYGYNDITTIEERYENRKRLSKRLEDYKKGYYKTNGGLPGKSPEEPLVLQQY
jgi:hypothetical protein